MSGNGRVGAFIGRLSFRAEAHQQARVAAAEGERIAHGDALRARREALAGAGQAQGRELRVRLPVPDVGRNEAARDGQPAEGQLGRAGCTERVARERLGAAGTDAVREDACHREAFHLVVLGRGGGMQVQVADSGGRQPCVRERGPHRQFGAEAFRMGRGDVVGVAGLPDAQEFDRGRLAGHEEQRCAFPDVDAAAVAAHGVADIGRGGFERGEAIHRQAAEGVHAAHEHRVAQAVAQQPACAGEGLGARCAGRRDGKGRTAEAQAACEEGPGHADFLLRVGVAAGQAGMGAVVGQGRFALGHARRAGAQHHADARSAVAGHGLVHRRGDLRERLQQQPVVAAVPGRERLRDGRQVHGPCAADAGGAPGNPAVLQHQARGVAAEQPVRHGVHGVPQGVDQAQGRQVDAGGHGEGSAASGAGRVSRASARPGPGRSMSARS